MKLFTIGFGGKSAEVFFNTLDQARVKTLVDIRLNNKNQLAGFTKAGDLEFFLGRISSISYKHYPLLAPDQQLLDDIRNKRIDWNTYKKLFLLLLKKREVDAFLKQELPGITMPLCLLCSEPEAINCHRYLVAERIQKLFPELDIIHL